MPIGKVALGRLLLSLSLFASCLAGCGASGQADERVLRKGVVERGEIDQVVIASGSVFPESRVNLSFQEAGMIQEVYVEVGSVVSASEPLARIISDRQKDALDRAKLVLRIQQLAYERLFDPPDKYQLAGAQAAVAGSIAEYDSLNAPPDPEDVQVAQLQYEQAYQAYVKADIELRAVQWYAPLAILDQYRATFGVAVSNLEAARLRLEQVQLPPNQDALGAASASIAQAQAQVDKLREGPSDLEIAKARIQVNQSTLAVERAQRDLDNTILRAPFGGVVSFISVMPGTVTSAGVPEITVIDDSHLHIEVNVDEHDIGKISTGQSATVRFDALPSASVSGQVTAVSTVPSTDNEVVTYSVRIELAPHELRILSGMTATADITTQRLARALIVPNWAVRFDRASGQAYVSILRTDGGLQDIPVALGLRGETHSQVIAGLEEGQSVAVSIGREAFSFAQESRDSDSNGGD